MAKSAKKKRQPVAAPEVANRPGLGANALGQKGTGKEAAARKLQTEKRPKRAGSKPTLPSVGADSEPLHEPDRLVRLLLALEDVRAGVKRSARTHKLLNSGVPKMAQKVVEEAAEVAIDAVRGERVALINESADLLFNLVVLWSGLGVTPADVWSEMDRREATLGLAEKLPKPSDGDL